jgi:hypothetical protein
MKPESSQEPTTIRQPEPDGTNSHPYLIFLEIICNIVLSSKLRTASVV